MTATDPRRLDEAIDDTLRAWPALTGQPVPAALFCAHEHPITGLLCNRLRDDCDGNHSPDGVDPWTPNPNTKDDNRA